MCGRLKRSGLCCNHFRRKSKVGAGDMGGGGRVDLVSLRPSIRCPPPGPGQETGCASVGGLIIGLSIWGWAPFVLLLLHSCFYLHHLRWGGGGGQEGGEGVVGMQREAGLICAKWGS